jgi:hypothetical protein
MGNQMSQPEVLVVVQEGLEELREELRVRAF